LYADSTRVSSTTLHLPYAGDYDWASTLRFLTARAVDGIERVDGELYRRTIQLEERTGVLDVGHDPDRHALHATLHLRAPFNEAAATTRLRRMFDLDADLAAITAHLAVDPGMASLVAARPALRVFGGFDGFEVAIRTINGQQVSVERARRLNGVLVERCGGRAEADAAGALDRVFPSPPQVLAADLAGMGMPGARVAALKSMAAAVVVDPHLLDPDGSLDDTIARLRAIPGVGAWTAHYIAMRACRQADAFPASDVGLLRGAADAEGRRPSPADLEGRAEAWRPWRAYAAHHLWAVDSTASTGVRRRVRGATVGA
jgi:AraC family transcriptional regulator of adaptative response / DNA-3-methyladenine glycosylase II